MTTTFGQEMVELAQELTEEFSEEIGLSTLKRPNGQAYNADTGAYTETFLDYTAYMVFENIQAEEVQNIDYMKEHEQCTVAGDDLTVTPQNNDIVQKPDTTKHRVVNVLTDQYGAAYIMHIERKNA